jgi:hypothetical protein
MGANQAWDVLEEAPRRARERGDPDDFPEEAAPVAAESGPLAGDGEVLAGEAADEKINGLLISFRPPAFDPACSVPVNGLAELCSSHANGSSISGSLDSGPSGGEDALAESINFYLTDACHARPLQAQIEAANPGK